MLGAPDEGVRIVRQGGSNDAEIKLPGFYLIWFFYHIQMVLQKLIDLNQFLVNRVS